MERQIGDLAHALDESEALAQRFVGKQPAVFLDYDGTLTPIRGRPQDAVISDKSRCGGWPNASPWSWSAAATARSCRSSWASTT